MFDFFKNNTTFAFPKNGNHGEVAQLVRAHDS